MTSRPKEKATDVILEVVKQTISLCTSLIAAAIAFAKFSEISSYPTSSLNSAIVFFAITIGMGMLTLMTIVSALANGSEDVSRSKHVQFPASVMIACFIFGLISLVSLSSALINPQ